MPEEFFDADDVDVVGVGNTGAAVAFLDRACDVFDVVLPSDKSRVSKCDDDDDDDNDDDDDDFLAKS